MSEDDEDRDGICQRCEQLMRLRDGCEPTPYCDECAHTVVDELTQANASLLSQRDAAVAECAAWRLALDDDYLLPLSTGYPDYLIEGSVQAVLDGIKQVRAATDASGAMGSETT